MRANKLSNLFHKAKIDPTSTATMPQQDTTGQGTTEADPLDPYSTTGSVGIKIIHNPPNAEFDIVLVHGLTGNRDGTWRHGTWTAENKLSLPEFLATDFPSARVMVYGYDANVLNFWKFWNNASIQDVGSYGGSLAVSIGDCRPALGNPTTPAVVPTRPIYFIAHSLGGLVTEQALLTCISGEKSLAPLVLAARGVIFLGVPHQGSGLPKYAGLVAKCLPSSIWSTNRAILKDLQKDNLNIYKQLEQPFQRAAKHGQLQHVQLYSFYETKLVHPLTSLIVSQKSGTTAADYDCSIEADHISMTKFGGPQDQGYVKVKSRLASMLAEDDRRTRAKKEEEKRNDASSARPNITGSTFHGPIKAEIFDARVQSAGRNINTYNYGIGRRAKEGGQEEEDEEDN